MQHRTARAYHLLALVLVLRPLGNLSLAWGMKQFTSVATLNPLPYLLSMLNPFVSGGIVLLILATLVRMAMLSVADLSFVLPMTAFGYVITTLLALLVLHEVISSVSWIGTGLICLGAAVVSSNPEGADTTGRESPVAIEQ